MIQRGRKSVSSDVVVALPRVRPRLTPPKFLTVSERAIFVETATQHPHLKSGDTMILAAYAQASTRSFKLSKKDDTKAWEVAVRAMLALARSLRLTPISSTRPESLARKCDSQLQGNAPWHEKYDSEDW